MPARKDLMINPLFKQKEAEYIALERKYKKLLQKLETAKTNLRQVKENIIHMQRQVVSVLAARMDTLRQLQAEVKILLQEASKSKVFKRQEKKILKEMAKGMEGSMFTDSQAYSGRSREEEAESGSADFFKEFAVAPTPEEGQSIRKLFLKLASRFHPDKAGNTKESQQLHTLMQRINEAYKAGDMATLLAIEAQYMQSEPLETPDTNMHIDLLERRIERLATDIAVLEDQLRRIKKESGTINRSDAGKMHKHMKKDTRFMDFMTKDISEAIQGLSVLRDELKVFLKTGILPDSLARELRPDSQEIELDDILALLLDMQEEENRRRNYKKKKASSK